MIESLRPGGESVTEADLVIMLHDMRFGGRLAASGQGAAFGGSQFTRDGCWMALDTMDRMPTMAQELLCSVPQMQGVEKNAATNESPGALPHQVFDEVVAGRVLPPDRAERVARWAQKWGVPFQNNSKTMAVYNSSDGPPLYLSTLAKYDRLYPDHHIMRNQFIHRPTGEIRTVGAAGLECARFIMRAIQNSEERGHGLYAVPNTNRKQTSPSGVFRDGCDSYFYPEEEYGRPVDYSYLAYIENQALAVDALTSAAHLYGNLYDGTDELKKEAGTWLRKADDLRHRVFDRFWMDDVGIYAAAVDAAGDQVKLESNAALEAALSEELLKGRKDAPDVVISHMKWLYSEDVMTPVGPRMLHRKFGRFEEGGEYYAYQGSGAVWPHATFIIAQGARRWGLHMPSYDMGVRRTLGWFNRIGEVVEMGSVDRKTNEPVYNPYESLVTRAGSKAIAAAELGQRDQGWSAAGALREHWDWKNGIPEEPAGSWQRALARQIMDVARDIPAASEGRPAAALHIDTRRGQELKRQRAERLGLAA
jgi:glycogen debranching enzyme